MKIALFNGGLGNQVFQYIFARYIEESTRETCFLDDSYFYLTEEKRKQEKKGGIVTVHNGYEIEKVFPNAKASLLSKQFTADVWNYMMENKRLGISIEQQLLDAGLNISVIRETGEVSFSGNIFDAPPNEFCPQISNFPSDLEIYYSGYWINKGWFAANSEVLRHELKFPNITDKINMEYQEAIVKTNSVAVHIRRGDFVTIGWALSEEYYANAVNVMKNNYNDAIFYIFSDDLDWCKENAETLGLNLGKDQVVYVDGNYDRKHNYIDMQLMSICKHMIISNSSFSYLAALLNENKEKLIINPTNREV